ICLLKQLKVDWTISRSLLKICLLLQKKKIKKDFNMSTSTLILLFSIGFIVYFSIGLKKKYYDYKNETDNINIGILFNSIAGIILGVILLTLYLIGLI